MASGTKVVEIAGASAVAAAAVAGTLIYAAMAPKATLFGRTMTAPKRPEEIALTFDDGPNPAWTPQLLDLLAQYNVRATFFLIGQYAAAQRSLVRQTHAAGHLVGNHTWTHPNLARTSSRQTREQLSRTSAELEQAIGAPVRYFRPPFGMRRPATLRIARELGLIPVTWNAIGNDWSLPSAEAITTRVTRLMERNLQRGDATNLVLHDGSDRTPAADRSRTIVATDALLSAYTKKRRFVTLDAWNS